MQEGGYDDTSVNSEKAAPVTEVPENSFHGRTKGGAAMNNTEEQHPVFIPRNFIEKGTFMGGMFKIRNAIEGGVLAILITIPVINLPLTLTVRIIILCMTALPAAMISLIGIGGESITAFLMNALRFLKNRGLFTVWMYIRSRKKYRIKKPRNKEPNQKRKRTSKATCRIFF